MINTTKGEIAEFIGLADDVEEYGNAQDLADYHADMKRKEDAEERWY